MRGTLEDGDLHTFGMLLDEGWRAKKRIPSRISSDQIDALYNVAKQNGAVGGKITGAGGGEFMLLYCGRPDQDAVRKALAGAGAHEMTFRFDTKGAHVTVNDPFINGDDTAGPHPPFSDHGDTRH